MRLEERGGGGGFVGSDNGSTCRLLVSFLSLRDSISAVLLPCVDQQFKHTHSHTHTEREGKREEEGRGGGGGGRSWRGQCLDLLLLLPSFCFATTHDLCLCVWVCATVRLIRPR